jgi:hypothetical protein
MPLDLDRPLSGLFPLLRVMRVFLPAHDLSALQARPGYHLFFVVHSKQAQLVLANLL